MDGIIVRVYTKKGIDQSNSKLKKNDKGGVIYP
jgi:hypothetical protein